MACTLQQYLIKSRRPQMPYPTNSHSDHQEQSVRSGQQAVQSKILNSITDQNFYLDLITIFLQLSKESGVPQQEILSIYQRLLLAKGIQGQSLFHLNHFDQLKNQTSQKIASQLPQFTSKHSQFYFIQLLSKLQAELAFTRQKDSQYHALKNFAAQKIGDLVVGSRKKEQTKQERFQKFFWRDKKQMNINRQGKLKQGIQQALMKIPKTENESHQLMKRVKKLKTIFGHRYEQEFEQYCQVFNCIFDSTQKLVVSAGEDGLIKVWSRQSGQLMTNLKGHDGYIIKIVVSPCNKYLISTASDGIRFFDFNSARTLGCWASSTVIDVAVFYQNSDSPMRIVFAQAKRLMLLRQDVMVERGNNMEILTLNDFEAFSLHEVNNRDNNNVNQIVINEKKILLIAFESGQIIIVQLAHLLASGGTNQDDQGSLRLLPYSHVFNAHKVQIMEIRWNQQCNYFTTGCKQGICKIWQSKNLDEKPIIISEFKIPKLSPKRKKKQFACNYLLWNCEGTHIIASFHEIPEGDEEDEQKARGQGQVLVYSLSQNAVVTQFTKQFNHVVTLASITSIDAHPFFPNIVLLCDKSGKILIIDIFLKTIINLFEERGYHLQHPQFRLIPTQCRFSKDGTNFIVGTQYGTISIYGYDVVDFYRIAPDQQFLKTDYLPFTIDSQTLRPIASGPLYQNQVRDINQIHRGQVCNMLGAPYRSMLTSQFTLFKNKLDQQLKSNRENLDLTAQQTFELLDQEIGSQNFQSLDTFLEKVKVRIQQYVKRQDAYKSINEELSHNHEAVINGQNSKYREQVQQRIKQKIYKLKGLETHHLKQCFRQSEQLNGKSLELLEDYNNKNSLRQSMAPKQRPKRRLKKLSERHQSPYAQFSEQENQQDFSMEHIQEKDQESDEQFEQSSSQEIYAFRNRRRPQRNSTRPIRSVTQNRKYFQDFELNQEENSFSEQKQNGYRSRGRPSRRKIQNEVSQNINEIDLGDEEQADIVRKRRKLNQPQEKTQMNLRNLKHQQVENQQVLCYKCSLEPASNSCHKCKQKSFCNYCKYSRGKESPYTCFQCKFKSNQQFVEKKNVLQECYRETVRTDSNFIPQIGDQVVYFFQGYQQFVSSNLLILNNKFLRDQDGFQILPHERYPQLLQTPICKVIDVQYVFPLRQPRISLFNDSIGRRPRHEQSPKSIQMILKLSFCGDNQSKQSKEKYKGGIIQFMVFFVPRSDFLIRKEVYQQALIVLSQDRIAVDSIVKGGDDQELQVVELKPADERFPNSIWKYLKVRKTDGKSLRRNKSNEKRVNIWDINGLLENHDFETSIRIQQEILVSQIQKLLFSADPDILLFIDYVDLNHYPRYREQVQIGVSLLMLQSRAKNYYYRSIQSLTQDIVRIHSNSVKFNGNDSQITKVASNLVKTLLNSIQTKKSQSKSKQNKSNIMQQISTRVNTRRKLKILDSDQSQKQQIENSAKISSGLKQKPSRSDQGNRNGIKTRNASQFQSEKIDEYKHEQGNQKAKRLRFNFQDNGSSEITTRRRATRNSLISEERVLRNTRTRRND